jgi:hypothetical protein
MPVWVKPLRLARDPGMAANGREAVESPTSALGSICPEADGRRGIGNRPSVEFGPSQKPKPAVGLRRKPPSLLLDMT